MPNDRAAKDARNKKDRDRRKASGATTWGGGGRGQGRKLKNTTEFCCNVLMGSWGDRWRCRGECKKFRKK